jgi:uncharacterized protein involved in exopolysaccharide biosynthesis
MTTRDREGNPALERFESQLSLLKLLVARVMTGFPLGPKPLVWAGALALWRAAQEAAPSAAGGFGAMAEAAVNSELLGVLHGGAPGATELPAELESFVPRLEAMAEALALQAPMGLVPYQAALARRYAGLPIDEFALPPGPPGSSEGQLLRSLGRLVQRRWTLLVSLIVMTDLAIGIIGLKSPKEFKATTTINTGIASGQSVSGTPIDWFKAGAITGNLTEMLQSRTVLERTAARLNLAIPPEKLIKRIDVDRVGQTDMMRISAVAKTPREAADLANTHTAEFIRFYQESQGADAKHADAFIDRQLAESARRLHQAEDQLKAFKEATMPEAQTTLATQLEDLMAKRGETARELDAARRGLSAVQAEISRLKRDPAFAQAIASAPEVDTAQERIKTLSQNLEDARTLYGRDNEVVKDLERQLRKATTGARATATKVAAGDPARADAIQRQIALKVEIAQDQAKLAGFDRAIADLTPKARNASAADITYKQLQREVTVREADYQQLSQRASQTRLAANGAAVLPITVIDPAVPPRKPEDGKTAVKLALGSLIAGILGLVVGYLLELKERGIATRQELVEAHEGAGA